MYKTGEKPGKGAYVCTRDGEVIHLVRETHRDVVWIRTLARSGLPSGPGNAEVTLAARSSPLPTAGAAAVRRVRLRAVP